MHWSLIASLIELQPSIFVTESKTNSNSVQDDLTGTIFDQISAAELASPAFVDHARPVSTHTKDDQAETDLGLDNQSLRSVILEKIVISLMSAFVRNRNLLGFFRRWDHQLVQSYRHGSRKILKDRTYLIWEDRRLNKALSDVLEQSLTQGQIASLIQEHTDRMAELVDAVEAGSGREVKVDKLAGYKRASSSTVIVTALLQSIETDEVLGALTPQLHALFVSYSTWVQDDRISMHSRLAHSWLALCQLLAKLWPIEIHSSVSMQKEMLYPLVERATKDIHAGRKEEHAGRRLNSHGRAAAFTFLLNACNHLQTVPSSEIIVQAGLQGFTNGLSSNQLDPEHSAQIFEIFCTYFVDLYGNLDAKACEQSLLSVLSKLSELNDDIRDTLSSSLSQSIINEGNSSLRTAYYKTLTEALARKHEDCLHSMSIKAISYITPSALPREQENLS